MVYRTEAEAWLQLVATPHEIAEQRRRSYISGRPGSVRPINSAHELQRESRAKLGPRNGVPATRASRGGPARGRAEETTALPARFHAVASGRAAAEIFYGKAGTSGEIGHWCWWNELYDPLSSFVPVLEPRPRRGFSFGGALPTGCATAAVLSVEPVHRREPDTAAMALPGSSRVAGVEGRWSL
jgi:hypothetical protein